MKNKNFLSILLKGNAYIPEKVKRHERVSMRKFRNIRRINLEKLLERDNYKCVYCQKDINMETVTIDHIIPLSRGGSNDLTNLACSCKICNEDKADDIWFKVDKMNKK